MRVHVDTWESNDSSPDCDAARKLVEKTMEDETTCEYAPEDECDLVWFVVSVMRKGGWLSMQLSCVERGGPNTIEGLSRDVVESTVLLEG